jgi:hypothetical protein
MHAHAAEVVAQARLEERSCVLIERLTGRPQNLIHDRRGFVGYGCACSFALDSFLFPTFRALTRSATIALSIQAGVNPNPGKGPINPRLLARDDLVSYAIGLLLEDTVAVTNSQAARVLH